MSSIINSLINSLESGEVIPDTEFGNRTIRNTVLSLVEKSNLELPAERRISPDSAIEVAERSLVASANRDILTRKYLVVRDVARFISVAAEGSIYGTKTEHTDLLPVAHPLSTVAHSLTAAALREEQAAWVASDPRIDEAMRPVVASAYAASVTSAERIYYFTRLASADPELVPFDISVDPETYSLVAAFNPFAGGNSRAARSLRARLQRRDSKGQFAEMGGGLRTYLKNKKGLVTSEIGRAVGSSPDGNMAEVEFKNHSYIPDGIYYVDASKAEAIQGILPDSALKGLPDAQPVDQNIDATPLDDFLSTKHDAPNGWNQDPSYKKQDGGPDKVYKSEDGYIVEVYNKLGADNQDSALHGGTEIAEGAKDLGAGKDGKFAKGQPVYVLKRDAAIYKGKGETEVVARTQSWADVQVSANEDEKSFDKAIADAPDGLANQGSQETGPTAADYVAAIQKKAKINPAAVDKALSDFINANPDQKFSKNFEGDPEHATSELIGRLAKGASQDEVSMELSKVMNDLPQDKSFAGLRKAVGALMDNVIDFKLSDLPEKNKGEDKKIAELPADVVPEAPATPEAPKASELDKVDSVKPFDYITQDQLDQLKTGDNVHRVALDAKGNGSSIKNTYTKNEDGTYTSIHNKDVVTADELFGFGDKILYSENYHDKYKTEQGVEALTKSVEDTKAAMDAYTGDDKAVAKLLEKEHSWSKDMLWFAESAKKTEANKIAYEKHQQTDWTTFEPGDEPNNDFIRNAPVGTVMTFNSPIYDDGDYHVGDLEVTVTKVEPDRWTMDDENGQFAWDKWTNDAVIKETDNYVIESIPEKREATLPDGPVNLDDYKQVSGPKGSNDGGIFEGPIGDQIYMKFPKSQLHGENEVLATELYKALGMNVANIQKGTFNGQEVTFSPILPNAKGDFAKKVNDPEYRKKVQDGFATDAWLANWDVAGTGFDNIMTDVNGEPVRIDPGGALLFRAQGGEKGDKFGEKVGELDTFVDGSNDYTEATFGEMTEDEKKKSAEKLLKISEAQIDEIVNNTITDPNKAEEVANTLKARRKDVLTRYGLEEAAPAEAPISEENAPAEDQVDPLDVPSAEQKPEALSGYTYSQNDNGVYYPNEKLSSDDLYALRNGTKVPANFPFIPYNTKSGDTLYFDENGTKRWGQYGAAGSLVRRKNEDGSYEYLVVKRNAKAATDGDVWSIPGGAHDSKDDAAKPQSTAARELKEEMGWKLPSDVTPSYSHSEQVSPDWAYDYEMFDIQGDIPQAKLSKEITETKWVSADELKQMSANGDLHSAISPELVDQLTGDSNSVPFTPVELQTGKWWTPDFNEDGTQKAFRKDQASTLKKGDIVTVKGSTGERDVIVTSDPKLDANKITFDVLNPDNGKSETYVWQASSEANILSDNKSAQEKLNAPEAPVAEEAPKAEETPKAPEAPAEVTGSNTYAFETDATDALLNQTDSSDGSSDYAWGSSTAKVYPTVNDQFTAIATDSNGNKFKVVVDSKEEAQAWVGDFAAQSVGAEKNPVTGKPVGEASGGVTVHKGGFLNDPTPAQYSKVEKLLALVQVTPEDKAKFENILNKEDLTHGEIGQLMGKLSKMPALPIEERQKPQEVDPAAEVTTEKLNIADGSVEQTKTTVGESASYAFSQDNKTVAEVTPSVYKSKSWDASSVADDGTVSKETLNSEDSALEWVGESKTADGSWNENPFAEKMSSDKVEPLDSHIISDEENNDLTPKTAFDTIAANLVMDELLAKHPDHKVLPNGDVVLKEQTYTNKYGKSYKYELVIRRTKRERFYAYIKETDLQTNQQRVSRLGNEVHSFKALSTKVASGKSFLASSDPRTKFNKRPNKVDYYTTADATEIDITPGLTSYIENPDTPKTPSELANGIAEFVAGMGGDNITVNKDVLDALTKSAGLHPGFVDQVLDIMAENKAKAAAGLPDNYFEDHAVPKEPHVSYNGGPAVKKGDWVDWTDPKTGKVYRGYVEHITYNHNSKDYLYSDQTLVVFPELNTENGYPANWQRWRVSSNLIVVQKDAPMSQPFSPKALEKVTQEDINTGESPKVNGPRFVKNQPLPKPAPSDKMETVKVGNESIEQKTKADGSVEHYFDGNEAGSVTFDETYKQWSSNDPFSGMGDLHSTKEDAIKHNLEVVVPQSIEEFKKQEEEQASAPEASKKPAPQTDEAPKVEVSENGTNYVEIDGVKHPLYNSNSDISAAAITATNTPKKWSELEAGDLIHIGGKWSHVVASGTGEDGVFRITTVSISEDGTHTAKTISLNENTKKFLDSYSTATVKPQEPMVPGAVSLEKESDPNAPASDVSLDALLSYEGVSTETDSKIAELTGKKLFGDGVTQGEVDSLLAELKNSGAKQKVADAPTTDEVVESVQNLNETLQTSDVSQGMSDATAKTIADGEAVKSNPATDVPAEVTVGQVLDASQFTDLGAIGAADVQPGDVLRYGVKGKYTYLQVQGAPNSEGKVKVLNVETGSYKFIKPNESKNKAYRPVEGGKAPETKDETPKSEAPKVEPTDVKVAGDVTTFPDVEKVTNAGTDKKSEAGYAQLGIPTEIDGVAGSSIGFGADEVSLWKHGFNDIKVKVGNDKYVIPGGIVQTSDEKHGGVVVDTNKADGTLDIMWVSGDKAGTLEKGVPASSVQDTNHWMSPETAANNGIKVDTAKIDAGKKAIAEKIANIKVQHANALKHAKEMAELEALKFKDWVEGSGIEDDAHTADVPTSWDETANSEAPSLATVLSNIHSGNMENQAAAMGQEVLVDAADIEDNRVRVSVNHDKNGKKQTRLMFTLTSWAGNAAAKAKIDDPETKKKGRLSYRRLTTKADGTLEDGGFWPSGYLNGDGNGQTYETPVLDADGNKIGTVYLHRANKTDKSIKHLGSEYSQATSYHNKVDIVLDGEATPAQIEAALKAAGVTAARPASVTDIRHANENKLISIFAEKNDGNKNFKGELRKKALENIEATYGVKADDMEVEFSSTGDVNFLLPEAVGKKVADMTNTKALQHAWMSGLPPAGKERAEFIVNIIKSTGLRPTTFRWAYGIDTSGMSSKSDGTGVGANYVFTKKTGSTSYSGSNLGFVFDAKQLFRRLDWYANEYDHGNGPKGDKNQIKEASNSSVYEVPFKNGISWSALQGLYIGDKKTREMVLEMLKAQGITHIGNTPIDQVIK